MSDRSKTAAVGANRPKVVLERTYPARVEELWELWTTKTGFESWWGPQGFRVEVHTIEARVGGSLHYDMIADAPGQIEAMKRMGRPTSHETRGTFVEISPHRRRDHTRDRLPGRGDGLREHHGGGVLPIGQARADGGHARSDAQ
jgi:Activator of Hsp90 ATPase homolog 1-like protein